MLKKLAFFIAVAACVPLAVSFASAAMKAEEPATCVSMLQQAVETNDIVLAEKYLDIDTVLEKAVASIVVDEKILDEASRYPAVNMALALGPVAGNELLRTLLRVEAHEYIRYGIVSGAFAGRPKADTPPYTGIFTKAFKGGDKDKLSFGKAAVTKIEGDTAYLKTTLVEWRRNRTYPLDLVVRRQKDFWRIVEVANAAELFSGGKKGE